MLPRVAVFVQYRGTRGPRLSSAQVRRRAERMLVALGIEGMELSVLLCDGSVMRVLNRRHRGSDYATDVLAFEMDHGARPDGRRVLGDIVISIPTAARQAARAGKDTLAEATMLLAHGLLHLLGLDHRTRTEDRRMRARTDLLISAASTRARSQRPRSGGKPPRPSRVSSVSRVRRERA